MAYQINSVEGLEGENVLSLDLGRRSKTLEPNSKFRNLNQKQLVDSYNQLACFIFQPPHLSDVINYSSLDYVISRRTSTTMSVKNLALTVILLTSAYTVHCQGTCFVKYESNNQAYSESILNTVYNNIIAFPVAGAKTWNALQEDVPLPSLNTPFATRLFNKSFPDNHHYHLILTAS